MGLTLAGFGVVAMLGGILQAAALPRTAGAEVRRQSISLLAFNPCADEVVFVTGELLLVSHFLTDAHGGRHGFFNTRIDGIAIGQSSGDPYAYKLVDNTLDNFVGAEEATRTFVVALQRLTEPHDRFVAQITFHVTSDANGQPTAEVIRLASRCIV